MILTKDRQAQEGQEKSSKPRPLAGYSNVKILEKAPSFGNRLEEERESVRGENRTCSIKLRF